MMSEKTDVAIGRAAEIEVTNRNGPTTLTLDDGTEWVPKPTWGVPTVPTVPGDYLYRYPHPDGGGWQRGRMLITAKMIAQGIPDDGTQWSGPIPEPVEPAQEGGGR